MSRRIVSLILTFVLLLSMLPASLAESEITAPITALFELPAQEETPEDPSVTPEPKPTEEPELNGESAPTAIPEEPEEPVTPEPEPTEEPELNEEPAPTAIPEEPEEPVTPTQEPAAEPTQMPVLPEIEEYLPVEADSDFVINGTTLITYNGDASTVTVPDGIVTIGDSAFFACWFTRVNLPSSVKYIEDEAFGYCENLTSITFPAGLETIGESAFEGCRKLSSVSIPAGVREIGTNAFLDCERLSSIDVNSANSHYASVSGVLYNKTCTELISYPVGKSATSFTVPGSVHSIGANAFRYEDDLRTITLPGNLVSIGANAFWACEDLRSISIPASVTSIGNAPLAHCSSLATISVGSGNSNYKVVDNVLFTMDGTELICYPCKKSGTSYTVPSGVTKLGYQAFSCNVNLRTITLPSTVRTLDGWVFEGCTYLTGVNLPEGITSIPEFTFSDCRRLSSITIPSTVTSIGMSAFGGCAALKSITIPSGVTEIGETAFCECSSLTSVTVPASVRSIGTCAFLECSALTDITLNEGLRTIGYAAFAFNSRLRTITIPSTVTYIDGGLFDGCSSVMVTVYRNTKGHQYCQQHADEQGFDYQVVDMPTPEPPAKPTMGQGSVISSTCLRVEWNRAENATGYELWRSDNPTANYRKIADTTALEYTDNACLYGKINYYKVRAYLVHNGQKLYSDYSVYRSVFGLSTPGIRTLEDLPEGVKITAATVANATGYYIYRCDTVNGTYTRLGTTTLENGSNTFLDNTVKRGKTYYYKARAFHTSYDNVAEGVTYVGPFSVAKSVTCNNTVPARVVMGPHTVISSLDLKLTWNAVPSTDGYELWRSDAADGTYTKVADVTSLQHTDRCLFGKINYYKCRAYFNVNGQKIYGQFSVYRSSFGLATPGIQTLTSTSQGIKITHASVANATGYYISRGESPNGPFTRIGQSSVVNGVNTFVDTTAVPGKTYYYRCNVYHISYTNVSTGVTYVGPLSVAKPCTR